MTTSRRPASPSGSPWHRGCAERAAAGRRRGVQLQARLLLSASCAALFATAATAEPGSAADLQVVGGVPGAVLELGGVASEPGRAEYELLVAGQGSRSALVWMPEGPPRTLIVLLHGATPLSGKSRDDAPAFMLSLKWRTGRRRGSRPDRYKYQSR